MNTRIGRRAILAAPPGLLLASGTARAAYPDRPIRLIVPSSPGSGFDVFCRLYAASMGPQLGATMVVENRPGAATAIGAAAAARSAPDGYTLLGVDNATMVFNRALFRNLAYDDERDFRPLGLTVKVPMLLVVPAQSPYRDARALIEAARMQPDRLNYATPGVGFIHHLAMARLMKATGTRMMDVQTRGSVASVTELIGNRLDTAVIDIATAQEALKTGQLRPLAVCSTERLEDMPEVPTIEQALDIPGFVAEAWNGLVVPAATPDPIVERLSAALLVSQREPAIHERARAIGSYVLTGGPMVFAERVSAERAAWRPLVGELGIQLD
ncbi:Bug family tripartite tricarboxylate transporter substrate binding protein [Muricoccus aerilatus]|uniref:Bug family tripartite tricarboxylate transporter substrate binding protein n=1 Tax=Muricoccus aerilatus TaxID=452982 RepID=UPI0005C12A77|nr:tripartite tricarboxylate transporter substrate binding protein [Roseomonas aerilata]